MRVQNVRRTQWYVSCEEELCVSGSCHTYGIDQHVHVTLLGAQLVSFEFPLYF